MARKEKRVLYASDLHIGHRTMAGYDRMNGVPGAPATVEERDALIIGNWNAVVGRNDDVWILGDVAYLPEADFIRLMRRLNGHKRIVMGNHDKTWVRRLGETHKGDVVSVSDYAEISDDGRRVVLSHFPIAFWNKQHRGAYHLYGHVHMTEEDRLFRAFGHELVECGHLPEWRAMNVGVMANGYFPMTLDQLIKANGLAPDTEFASMGANHRMRRLGDGSGA